MVTMTFEWNAAHTRFGARAQGDESGYAVFVDVDWRGDTLVVLHTETAIEHRGEGLAGRLTQALLDESRAHGWRVDPRCPYTAGWIQRHPDYADLLDG